MKGLLSRVEILIAAVLFIIFLIWTSSKCKETKARLQEEKTTEISGDSLSVTGSASADDEASSDLLKEALHKKEKEIAARSNPAPNSTSSTPAATSYGKLYITIDKLKLRSEPGLKSKVLGELPLFSQVYFMEEVTDSSYTLSLGKKIANEPYVKVKTQRGTVGWVYGAGVNYYKKKTSGVLE